MYDLSKCAHPKLAALINPVTGTMWHDTCYEMRISKCGPDAKYFEPKLTWKQKLMNYFNKVMSSPF